MYRFKFVLFLLIFLNAGFIRAQHVAVFPGLSGETLADAMREAYRPNFVFTYGEARDTLFSKILAKNDSLSCLYTDYTIYLDPNLDPTEDAFAKGINTEHLWPRSKGASHVQAEANMYHIFPTRENVNNDRGNLPFNEIPDPQTNWWYYKAIKTANIPATNKDLYSEIGQGFFEPAEGVKGDVARAMFYFYTIYRPEADAADPAFFAPQRATLCQWHFDDPVDSAEWERNVLIAQYQDGKENPFILDCTAAQRAYCSEFQNDCIISSTAIVTINKGLQAKIFPLPCESDCTIEISLPQSGDLNIIQMDVLGRTLSNDTWKNLPAGMQNLQLKQNQGTSASSFYLIRLTTSDGLYQVFLKGLSR
jgi:hypothetical protein